MKGKVLSGTLLVRVVKEETIKNGIILPETFGHKGVIEIVGKDSIMEKMEVKVGDEIFFKKGVGKIVPIIESNVENTYILISQSDILIFYNKK